MVAVTSLDVEADDEEALYRLLGTRLKMIERDPSVAGEFAPVAIAPAELGFAVPDLLNFGRDAFLRIAGIGQGLVCGTEANQGFYLQRIFSTLNTDTATVTAAVATLLIGQLAIAPAIAGVVATIIVGKVAPKSLAALCQTWGAKVAPAGTATPPAGQPTTTPPAGQTTTAPAGQTTAPGEPPGTPADPTAPPAQPPADPAGTPAPPTPNPPPEPTGNPPTS
jgi:hypothetical protein